MGELKEVVDGPVSNIPLTTRQYGMLAVAEFSFYFDELPPFEPLKPGHRPVLDTHVGTWVEHPDHQDGYAMLWEARPQRKDPAMFEIAGKFIKTCRDPQNPHIVDKTRKFEIFSNNNTALGGERLAQDFDNDELLLIQHIVRKNQKYRREIDVPMDKYVVAALFSARRTRSSTNRKNPPKRR